MVKVFLRISTKSFIKEGMSSHFTCLLLQTGLSIVIVKICLSPSLVSRTSVFIISLAKTELVRENQSQSLSAENRDVITDASVQPTLQINHIWISLFRMAAPFICHPLQWYHCFLLYASRTKPGSRVCQPVQVEEILLVDSKKSSKTSSHRAPLVFKPLVKQCSSWRFHRYYDKIVTLRSRILHIKILFLWM